MLTLLLGIGKEKSVLAAVLVLLGHALYKATLFMVAGDLFNL
jgi:multicomponent Na+:H+ antiporter subunit A